MRWPWSQDKSQERAERDSEEARASMGELTRRLENIAARIERMLDERAVNGHGSN